MFFISGNKKTDKNISKLLTGGKECKRFYYELGFTTLLLSFGGSITLYHSSSSSSSSSSNSPLRLTLRAETCSRDTKENKVVYLLARRSAFESPASPRDAEKVRGRRDDREEQVRHRARTRSLSLSLSLSSVFEEEE